MLKRRIFRKLPWWAFVPVVAFVATGFSIAADAADCPIIEQIEGDKVVVVKTPEGNRVGTRGTEINFGDRIKTGPHASAKVLYPDGSKLLIGRATEMEVKEGIGTTQMNELHRGEVRGIIKKPKGLSTATGGPPRFVIRSKSAVMGVRGTDFVYGVGTEAEKAALHTLEGTVEIAKDEATLMSGKGTPVKENQFIETDAVQKAIEPPKLFDQQKYTAALQKEQPEFVSLVKDDPELSTVSRRSGVVEAAREEKPDPRFKIFSFQIAGAFVKQGTGGQVVSTQVSWNPWIRLIGPLTFKLHGAVTPLKGARSGEKFLAVEGAGLVSFTLLRPIVLEAGMGVEVWPGGYSKSGSLVLANVAWSFGHESFIERIFIGASRYAHEKQLITGPMMTGGPSYNDDVFKFKAGVGFQF